MATRETVDLHTLVIKAGIRPSDITDALHEKRLRIAAFGKDDHTTRFYADEIRDLFWVEFGRYENSVTERKIRGLTGFGAATLAGAAGTMAADGAGALLSAERAQFPPLPSRSWAVLNEADWIVNEDGRRISFTAKRNGIALAVFGGRVGTNWAGDCTLLQAAEYVAVYGGALENLAKGYCAAGSRLADISAGSEFSIQIHCHQTEGCTVLHPRPFYWRSEAIPLSWPQTTGPPDQWT